MKKVNYIFLIIGVLFFILLVRIFGIRESLADITKIGLFGYFLIIIIFFFNHILLSYGWKILITHPIKAAHFMKLVFARIAGDATAMVNTLAAAAGEPLKAMYVQDIIPLKTGLASVVLDRTIHMIGNMLLIIVGIFFGFFKLNVPMYALASMFVLFLFFLYIFIKIVKKQQNGFFEYLVSKLPLKLRKKLSTPKNTKRIQTLDEEIKFIFSSKDNMHHFYISLLLHTLPILITGTLEVYMILYFSNNAIPLADAMLVYLFGLFITTIIFFIPLNIGTIEGSYSLALAYLNYDPQLGILVSLVRRIRTFVWTAIGMGLLSYAGLTKTLRNNK